MLTVQNDILKTSILGGHLIKLIEKEMTSVAQSDYHSFSTPLTVDINVGDNWGMLH